jgi:hypothetical protein
MNSALGLDKVIPWVFLAERRPRTGCWNLDRFAKRGLGYGTLMRAG